MKNKINVNTQFCISYYLLFELMENKNKCFQSLTKTDFLTLELLLYTETHYYYSNIENILKKFNGFY